MAKKLNLNVLDRAILALAPSWGLNRARARAAATMVRNFEAASPSRRTTGWPRSGADANIALIGASFALRAHARDLVRNNAWAQRGLRTIHKNTVGWGLIPSFGAGPSAAKISALWKRWANEADADGLTTLYGLQSLVMRAVAQDGEVLIRRRMRRPTDDMSVPLQVQVLEADFLDSSKQGFTGLSGGPVIQGIEFDKRGQRTAYWLYKQHPGSGLIPGLTIQSVRVPASEVLHVFRVDRPGQARGVTWFAAAILRLKDFDEWEDATLMRQKIAACFSAFVSDTDGSSMPLGGPDEENGDPLVETLEPGAVAHLPPGKTVTFGNPPSTVDGSFPARELRAIAAAIGVTYEDLTGDFSQVNYSSARMSRLNHYADVHDWRWNMLVPQFLDPVYAWFLEAAELVGEIPEVPAPPPATWTPPPMAMIEPDKEGLALQRMVRGGFRTLSDVVREQGSDPDAHFAEMAADNARLDKLGLVLDSDPRVTNQSGQTQAQAGSATDDSAFGAAGDGEDGAGGDGAGDTKKKDAEDPASDSEDSAAAA